MSRFILLPLLLLSLLTTHALPIPYKWKSHVMKHVELEVSSSPPTFPTTCPISRNTTILNNTACIQDTEIWQTLITQWDDLTPLARLLNTTTATLFLPTNRAIERALGVMLNVYGIKLNTGEETGMLEVAETSPPTDALLQQLSRPREEMEIAEQHEVMKQKTSFPLAAVYYNLSYPFPPPPLTLNLTLTPQQILSIVKRLPKPLRSLLVSTFAYHVLPNRNLTRDNTCFMQAVETAMEGNQVEQVDGGQRLLIQNYKQGMNATAYRNYLRTRHEIVQGVLQPSLPQQDLRILTADHSERFQVDPIIVDILSSNGVIHVIDKLILVPTSIVGYLMLMDRTTSYFTVGLIRHGRSLYQHVQHPNSTIFIPTNYAFERHGINPATLSQQQWKQLIQAHVVTGVNVLILPIGNPSHCNFTSSPLHLTTLANDPLILTLRTNENYTYYINDTIPLIEDNVIVTNGVIHLVDNLLLSNTTIDEIRTAPVIPTLIPTFITPPCPSGTNICSIHNITQSHHMLTWQQRSIIPVCYNTTTYVCYNQSYLCPVEAPLLCKGTTLSCYAPTQYVCTQQANGTNILTPVNTTTTLFPPFYPIPSVQPGAQPLPEPQPSQQQAQPIATPPLQLQPVPQQPPQQRQPGQAPQPLPQPRGV